MALKDIISSIADDATKQVAAIKQENKKQLTQIKEHWQEEVAQQRQAVKQRWQLETERKVNQSTLKLKTAAQNKVLMEKGAEFEEIGRNAVVSQLAIDLLDKITTRVLDARESVDRRG